MVICLYGRVWDETPAEQVDSERGEAMKEERGELVKAVENLCNDNGDNKSINQILLLTRLFFQTIMANIRGPMQRI